MSFASRRVYLGLFFFYVLKIKVMHMDFPVVRAFLMRIGTLVLSLFLGACIRQNPVHAPESALAQSSPQALMESHTESFAQIIANWPDKMIVANGDSLSQLRGMSPLERAALFIATDLSSVTRGYVDPLLVPYVEASTSEIEISRHIQEFDIISRNGKLYRSTEEHKAY